MHQDATLYGGRPQPRGLSVRWGSSPLPKKGAEPGGGAPKFRPMSIVAKRRCMDQDATWYGGRPQPTRDCVRCGRSYPHKKGTPHPIFGPCLLWPNGWMDEDAAWYGSRSRPRPHCTRRGPSSRESGTAAPPLFSTHVYCGHGRPSAIAELLFLTRDHDSYRAWERCLWR